MEQRSLLKNMFDKYVSSTMSYCNKYLRTITPILAVSEALTICKLLEGLLLRVRLICWHLDIDRNVLSYMVTCKGESGLSNMSTSLHL